MSKQYKDEDWLYEEYVEKGRSQSEIAEDCGCTQKTISNWLAEFNIPTRKMRNDLTRPARFEVDNKGYEQLCSVRKKVGVHRLIAVAEYGFDAVAGMEVHHKNGIPWANWSDNLEVMTKSEHAAYHNTNR
jgi:transcriptional regulator with XRE-family HTH domain